MAKPATRLASFALTAGLLAAPAVAQPPAPSAPTAPPAAAAPPPPWTGSAGFGYSLNRGNTDTSNLNLSFEATHDPHQPATVSVWKFKGLYLRGDTNGARAVDRLFLDGRNERSLTARVYAFGELQYLEDQFKAIDYLWAPAGGIGYKVIAAPMTTLTLDGGLGVKFEKNPDVDRRTDAVVTMSDKFEHKLSKTASITQAFNALWKAQDFGDALYTLTAGVAASLTTRTQLKLEWLDSLASRPPTVEVKRNDVALLSALVYKF